MAQARTTVAGKAIATVAAAVAPATSETVATANHPNLYALINVGGTATTVTIVSPGAFHTLRTAMANVTTGAITSTSRLVRLDQRYADANGNVTVTFSQVTGVTWQLLDLNPERLKEP